MPKTLAAAGPLLRFKLKMKKIFKFFVIILSLGAYLSLQACASAPKFGPATAWKKTYTSPQDYYQKTRPALYTDLDKASVQKVGVDTFGAETRRDRNTAAVLGVIGGLLAVGGVVAGVWLLK